MEMEDVRPPEPRAAYLPLLVLLVTGTSPRQTPKYVKFTRVLLE